MGKRTIIFEADARLESISDEEILIYLKDALNNENVCEAEYLSDNPDLSDKDIKRAQTNITINEWIIDGLSLAK